jgi:serine/threonine protein kinase
MKSYSSIIERFYFINRDTPKNELPDGFCKIKKEVFRNYKYVIKFTNSKKNKDLDLYAYYNEIRWLKYLQKFEFVPRLYKTIEYQEDIYILMESFKGNSLDALSYGDLNFLQKNSEEFKIKLNVILNNLKNEQLIHRDLRPHNIILVRFPSSFDIKIIDFQYMRKINKDISDINSSHYYKVIQNIGGIWRDKDIELNSYKNDETMIDKVINNIVNETILRFFIKKIKGFIK